MRSWPPAPSQPVLGAHPHFPLSPGFWTNFTLALESPWVTRFVRDTVTRLVLWLWITGMVLAVAVRILTRKRR